MKKTNLFYMAFSLLFVFVVSNAAAFAQSTDIDNPTVVTQSVVQGKHPGNTEEDVVYYYTFTAGPGILKITTDQKSGGITGNYNLSWELTDTNFNEIESEIFYGTTTLERKVKEIKLTKKQKVILKVELDDDVQLFKFQFTGAVAFTPVMSGGNENIPEISGDTTTQSTQQICMPRNGIIIMTMKDGKKAKVDLSKVQKIEIQ
ncbi:MAG: hypothetical protein ABIP06_04275 [Pyrinomonadaceae bacterium]